MIQLKNKNILLYFILNLVDIFSKQNKSTLSYFLDDKEDYKQLFIRINHISAVDEKIVKKLYFWSVENVLLCILHPYKCLKHTYYAHLHDLSSFLMKCHVNKYNVCTVNNDDPFTVKQVR